MNLYLIQERVKQGKQCPYCLKEPEYINSTEVYGKDYGMMYICKPCQAWVGVHKGTDRALGRLADANLRVWKRNAHEAFDKLWKEKLFESRSAAYFWLAIRMNIEDPHIGEMDITQCEEVWEICTKYYSLNNKKDHL